MILHQKKAFIFKLPRNRAIYVGFFNIFPVSRKNRRTTPGRQQSTGFSKILVTLSRFYPKPGPLGIQKRVKHIA
jgi:hypothetical protein